MVCLLRLEVAFSYEIWLSPTRPSFEGFVVTYPQFSLNKLLTAAILNLATLLFRGDTDHLRGSPSKIIFKQ